MRVLWRAPPQTICVAEEVTIQANRPNNIKEIQQRRSKRKLSRRRNRRQNRQHRQNLVMNFIPKPYFRWKFIA